jgi:hypothetical protein
MTKYDDDIEAELEKIERLLTNHIGRVFTGRRSSKKYPIDRMNDAYTYGPLNKMPSVNDAEFLLMSGRSGLCRRQYNDAAALDPKCRGDKQNPNSTALDD